MKIADEGEGRATDILEIDRPGDLRDIATLGLTLSEAKQLLSVLQQEIVAAQARTHAALRPDCPCGRGVRHVKDYRGHVIATLFGQVVPRLPRLRCTACGAIETGIEWPPHCRSTPELDWDRFIDAMVAWGMKRRSVPESKPISTPERAMSASSHCELMDELRRITMR